ncbi:MAG: hypothetical protein JST19_17445 [Bacteroidetes bacterium]|nr:hypothetical protein [Bacteroidota bacterium]
MSADFIYAPFFRARREEAKVFTGFDFGDNMIPGIEIFRGPVAKPRRKKKGMEQQQELLQINASGIPFEKLYLPTLGRIKSKKIFVDIPVHMERRGTSKEVTAFLSAVAYQREIRTAYMLKLAPLSKKIIPVISTYYKLGEPGSIKKQEVDLRGTFARLAFRTFLDTFDQDMCVVRELAREGDYLILDLKENLSTPSQPEIADIIEALKDFDKCPVIILRSVICKTITNLSLTSGAPVERIDNSLMSNYKQFHATGFGDYAGIKKDDLVKSGGNKNTKPSPGFIIYDPIGDTYFGFRGSDKRTWSDFEDVIVPEVLNSSMASNMALSPRNYLAEANQGWTLLKKIHDKSEKGKNAGKFKRISMEHYIFCLKTKINSGDFS